MENQETRVTVSFERKKSDGNYGTGGCMVIWTQVPVGASKEEIAALAQTSDDCLEVLKPLVLAGVTKKANDQNGIDDREPHKV